VHPAAQVSRVVNRKTGVIFKYLAGVMVKPI